MTKNDDEKWARKIQFEIPLCAKLFSLTYKGKIFAQNEKFSNKNECFANGGVPKKFAMVNETLSQKFDPYCHIY